MLSIGVKRLKDSVQTSSLHFLRSVCFEPPALVRLTQAFKSDKLPRVRGISHWPI